MNKIFMSVIFGALFFTELSARVILQNDGILNERVVGEIELIGSELLDKTAIFVGVVAIESLDGKGIKETLDSFSNTIPYTTHTFILLVRKEHIVEIYQTQDLKKDFDKDKILSPYPGRGSILPILVNVKKGEEPNYNAAILNGYADIAEKIAKSHGIELESAIGNTNRNFINAIRALVYGSILFVILFWAYHRYIKKD